MTDIESANAALPVQSSDRRPELPLLDFSRLNHLHDDVPLHEQQKTQVQKLPIQYDGRASAPQQPYKRTSKLRLARLAHLDNNTKAKIRRSVQTAQVKSWLHAHGYVVKADKLHPAVTRVIEEWFSLVDQDNSRTLEHHELLAALKEAQIPCDDATISEMISLMDVNKDGVIDWEEFEVFMTEEFAAGKSLLSGEYLLPSGTSLNFGVMIGKLKRNKLLRDIMEDPNRRNRWAAIANNPDALGRELATMQEAAEVTNLTLEHLKRGEGRRVAGATPRTQLTAALMQAMDEGRPVSRATEPIRNLAEKLRNGIFYQSHEMPQGHPSALDGLSSRAYNGRGHTPRGSCPDPAASPLTPNSSEGGLSSSSSLDMLMQLQFQARRNAHHGAGGGASAEDTTTPEAPGCVGSSNEGFVSSPIRCNVAPGSGTRSTISHSAEVVARYLASQHMCQSILQPPSSPPSPLSMQDSQQQSAQLTCDSVASLGGWVDPGTQAAEQQYPNASGRGTEGSCQAPPHTAGTSLPATRRNDKLSATGPAGINTSFASTPCSDAFVAQAETPCLSVNRLAAPGPRHGSGAAASDRDRDRSLSPSPASAPVLQTPGSGLQPDPALQYLSGSTASHRAHVRPSSRVISQVGLMAKELRAAPGRYTAEPPGLPPAVLAATRGQWSLGAVRSGTGSGSGQVSSSMDGFGPGSQLVSSSGSGSMASMSSNATPGAPPDSRSSLLADLRPASSPSQPQPRSYGTSCNTLPFLTQTSHSSEVQDAAAADDRADVSSAGGVGVRRRVSRSAQDGGSYTREKAVMAALYTIVDASMQPPIRPLASTAWESSASTRVPLVSTPPDSTVASKSSSPRNLADAAGSSRGQSHTASTSNDGDIAAVNATAGTQLMSQPNAAQKEWSETAGSGAGGAAPQTAAASSTGKALKPTSIMTRISPGFPPHARVMTPRLSNTTDGDSGGESSGGDALGQRRVSNKGQQRWSGASAGMRGFIGGFTPAMARNPPVVEAGADLAQSVNTDAESAMLGLATASAGPFPNIWNYDSDDGEGGLFGGDSLLVMAKVKHTLSPCRHPTPRGAAGHGRGRASGANQGGGNGAQTRTRESRSGDNSRPAAVGRAKQHRDAASAAAVTTALLDALPLRLGILTQSYADGKEPSIVAVADSAVGSSHASEFGSVRSSTSSSLPMAPASADGRGGPPQAMDPVSNTRRSGGSNSPGRSALAFFGQTEAKPPSRARTPLSTRGDREDSIDSSWRAATASLLQMQLNQHLNDPNG